MEIHAIVPAGGYGRRLWPWSTAAKPKFLLNINGTQSLVQQTATRLAPICQSLTFVTGAPHREALAAQVTALDLSVPVRCVAEPSPRDSMAAIALGAALIEQRYGNCVVGSFAADHLIANPTAFCEALAQAVPAAKAGWLTTIGIEPTEPATGFGYIEVGPALDGELNGVHRAQSFTEKPDAATASAWLATGNYLWNAGMFVVRSDVLLDALEARVPGSGAAVRKLAAGWETLSSDAKTALWQGVVAAPIDTVLAEPLARDGRVAVVPARPDLGWSDVGDWEAVRRVVSNASELANLSPEIPVYTDAAPAALVRAENLRGVAIIGIPGAVVVESAGQLLVTTQEFAQNVKVASSAADNW